MKKFLVGVILSVFAIAGALLMLNFFGSTDFQINGLEAELRIDFERPGMTEVQIPPLGKIQAKTHVSPAGIKITLKSVDLNKLKVLVEQTSQTDELVKKVESDVKKSFKALIYKVMFLGVAGGLLSILLLQRRRWYEYLYGAVLGLVTVAFLLNVTYNSYNTDGFQAPEYEGMLKTAPWMISLVQEGITKFDLWGKQLQSVADNLYDMFQRVDSLEAVGRAGNGDLRVLHVSDLHNNPAAFDFIEQVAGTFQVDFIIDTGDISDLGTPLEVIFLEKLQKLGVPYLFVPGNHETPEVINELKAISNVRVLEGQSMVVKGVRIVGTPDQSAYSQSIESANHEKAVELSRQVEEEINKMKDKPDVLAVHNHRLAAELAGTVPVILHGHDHAYKIQKKKGSIIIDAGTTGASGIGGLETKKDTPYSLVVLQFKKNEAGYHLIAADTIKVSNLQSGYSLERQMFPELYKTEAVENRPATITITE